MVVGSGGQLHSAGDRLPERRHPEGLDRHPDLERAERATELQPAVGEIRMVLAPQGVLEHVVVQPERGLQSAGVLHQQTPRLVGLEEPLVRVQPDGIGAFHSA